MDRDLPLSGVRLLGVHKDNLEPSHRGALSRIHVSGGQLSLGDA